MSCDYIQFSASNVTIPCVFSLVQKPTVGGGPISSADWVLDDAEMEAAFNEKTKAIVLNTPNNPLGKVRQQYSYLSWFLTCCNICIIVSSLNASQFFFQCYRCLFLQLYTYCRSFSLFLYCLVVD